MAKILIVYHSQSGNTQKMANAVAGGARSIEGVDVVFKKAADAKCGADKKVADAKCGATKKAADAKCGADKKVADGKCGAK